MVKNFKSVFNGDYGVKLTPGKLRTFCEMDWPDFGVGWPSEGSQNKVNRVFEVVVGEPRPPDQFLYIDCWQDAVLSQPTWLKLHLEEAWRAVVVRVAAASKCRKKCKKLEKATLAGDPEGTSTPFCATVPTFATTIHLFASTLGRRSSIQRL
jgi:hypothetical protein